MAAQDEFVLLERVFLRIGAAESDEQLQNSVSKFLLPVLLKLSSSHEGVRKKVMELLIHINKRLKSRPQVQLPVEALVLQYQDPSATSFVINFTIIYIKMGFPRLPVDKQIELIPNLLSCLEGKPIQHQDSILLLLIPVMQNIKIPSDPERCKTLFGLRERAHIAKLFSEFLLEFLFLPYGISRPSPPPKNSSQGVPATSNFGLPPPGLSEQAFKRVTGEQPLPPDHLEQAKLGVVKFLSCGVYSEIDIVPHLIVASSDTRHSVASAADMELKRIIRIIDWNNRQLMSKLLYIFLGTVTGKEQSSVRPEQKRMPANTRIRLKLFNYLLKSREATMMFPSTIQVVFESLYGQNTNIKLKTMAVQFVHHICTNCSEARLNPFGTVLLSGMLKLISESSEEPQLRALAYTAVGKLGFKLPHLVAKDVALIQTYFEKLVKESQDTRVAVQESLHLLAKAFTNMDTSTQHLMEVLIMNGIESSEHQVREMSLYFAVTVFPPDHIPSRYVVLLASGDGNECIRREAVKYLNLPSNEAGFTPGSKKFPHFLTLVSYIAEKAECRLQSHIKYPCGNLILPFNKVTFLQMLCYMRNCLATSAEVPAELLQSNSIQDQAPIIAQYVKKIITVDEEIESTPIFQYLKFHLHILPSATEHHVIYSLLEIVAVVPDVLPKYLCRHLPIIKNMLMSSKEGIRENAAQLVAVLIVNGFDESVFYAEISELMDSIRQKQFEGKHGALLALGYALGRKLYFMKKRNENIELLTKEVWFLDAVKLIISMIKSSENLCTAACISISEIARNGQLPLPEGQDNYNGEEKAYTKEGLINVLCEIVRNGKNSAKCREWAAKASSYLCVGDPVFLHNRTVLEGLLESIHEVSDVEVNFTIGEALCHAVIGNSSSASRDPWVESEIDFIPPAEVNEKELQWLLTEILDKYIIHNKPNIRQAACIFILALLKKCGSQHVIRFQLKNIQSSLLNLLADNSDLTQDVASKGLSLLYDLSNESEKQELVSLLVDSFMTGYRSSIKVMDDSKIFEPGSLGKSLAGGSLSTYKELCSLASDLNQPDLIYKFMHLANHNAIWNSKKGIGFGFGNLADQAKEHMALHLPKIVPKLYRYQYDTVASTRNAFSSIWQTVVPDPQKAIDKYLKEILEDLIENMTDNQWRVRESSCLALSDLLRGRNLIDAVDYLPKLWENCFRVRDDIKESVRNAAEAALKALNKATVRLCDANSGKSGERSLSIVLPCLVRSGLGSSVDDVRNFSLSTVIQLSKNAGALLKPHLPLLITALLEALSGLEPQMLSYLSVRLESHKASQDKLDAARISASLSSPMMETINQSVQYMDGAVLHEFIPRFIDLTRSSVGLGTKAGCAHLAIALTHHCSQDLQPFAGKLLGMFMSCLSERNSAVRKNYAAAIGHLVKVAKDSNVEKLITKIQKCYMEKEENTVHSSCAHVVHAIGRHSPDVLRAHSAQILPLSFFAMHEESTSGNKNEGPSLWEEVWIDFTPGTEMGIKTYLDEIIILIQQGMECQSWLMKKQSASTVASLASKLGVSLGPPYLGMVLNVLISALSGRTWDGKELLLQALSSVCINCSQIIQNQTDPGQPGIDQIVDVLIRESKKEKLLYKQEAIKSLSAVIECYRLDRFSEVYEILQPFLIKDLNENVNDDDGVEESSNLVAILQFRTIAYEAIGQTWPETSSTQEQFKVPVCTMLVSGFRVSTWKIQLSILKSVNKFLTRLQIVRSGSSEEDNEFLLYLTDQLLCIICQACAMKKYSSLRSEALLVAEGLLQAIKGVEKKLIIPLVEKSIVKEVLTSLMDDTPSIKTKASELLKVINEITV